MSEGGAAAAPLTCSKQAQSRASPAIAEARTQNFQLKADGISNTDEEPNDRQCFYDYSNGGPRFDLDAGQQADADDIRVLAQYQDFAGATAALTCRVGAGCAVLSGTHPELDPHWLSMTDRAIEHVDSSQGPGKDNAATVQEHLEQTQTIRRQFWLKLLHECGLQDLQHSDRSSAPGQHRFNIK